MKNIVFFLFLITINSFSQKKLETLLSNHNLKNVPYISVEELVMQKTKVILLDAREQKEYNTSHIKNAIYVGYNNFKIKKTLDKLPNKEAKIVVYCSLGIRSETIAHKLIKNGYTNVFNLYGGIFEWKNNNFTVINTQGKKTDKVHTFNKKWSKWLLKGEKIYE